MNKKSDFPEAVFVTLIQRENDDKAFPYCGETIDALSEDLSNGDKVAIYRLEGVRTFRRTEIIE